MAIYSYQAPDGRIVDLEGDSPATEQELEQVFASLPPVSPIVPQETISPEQQSVNQFIQSRRASPLSRVGSAVGGLLNTVVVDPLKAVASLPSQIGEVLGRNSVVPANENPLTTTLLSSAPLARAVPELAQTGLEAGGRALFTIGDVINQLVDKTARNVSGAIDNPVETALRSGLSMIPGGSVAMALEPRTPTESEINQFLQDQQRASSIESVLSQPVVPEALGTANIPLAENLNTAAQALPIAPSALRVAGRAVSAVPEALMTGARAVTSPIQTGRSALSAVRPSMAARIAPATLEESTIASLGLGPDDLGVISRVPTAVESTLQTTAGKAPKTAEEAIDAMTRTRKRLYEERLSANKTAEKEGLKVNLERSLQDAENSINSQTNLSPARKEAMIKELRDTYAGEKTPMQGQTIQEELNDELSKAYANETIDQLSLVGKRAFRDSVAGQMDEIGQVVTGTAETPYSDIGNLIEVQGKLQRNLNELRVSQADTRTGIRSSPGRIPTTRLGAASRISKSVLTPFQKTQIEKLDQNVQRIFSEQPSRPPRLPLESSVISELRSSLTPTARSIRESQIQALIQSYPRNIRSDPALARIVAEAELGP